MMVVSYNLWVQRMNIILGSRMVALVCLSLVNMHYVIIVT